MRAGTGGSSPRIRCVAQRHPASWRSPEGQQTKAAERAAEAELEAWLAAQPRVVVHSHGGLAPEQWPGEVDSRMFYFRERHDEWRIELNLRKDAGNDRRMASPP